MNVGYTFVNVLLRRENGKLGVDMNLLNDVVVQNGGGGEPFTTVLEPELFGAAVGAADKVAGTAQTVVQDHIIGTTQNVAEITKEKVVQFADMATGSRPGMDPEETNADSASGDVVGSQETTQSGAKKDV